MNREATLILPTQLFQERPQLQKKRIVFLVEFERYFSDFRYHKQKILLHRATMRMYYDYLVKLGYEVCYIEHPAMAQFKKALKDKQIEVLYMCDPVDKPFQQVLDELCNDIGIKIRYYDSPAFLNNFQDNKLYFSDKKMVRHHLFYREQRMRLNILLDAKGKPVGGKWSFDEENREPLKEPSLIRKGRYHPRHDVYYIDAVAYVNKNFSSHPGAIESFNYPITFQAAERWLEDFLEHRFSLFGPYQDAMLAGDPTTVHSLLSPLLNIGLLTPAYVVEKSLAYAKAHKVPITCVEGFIRQIIGWREYVRGVYDIFGEQQRVENYFNHKHDLPKSYWKGNTGLVPVDDAIQLTLEYAYVHHIMRLMVLGTSMLLLQVNPYEVYKWFMELFIDAYDWVMVPNVYGMSQYADGGLMTTKPYLCGSSYLLRMSNYPKGGWTASWDALYWHFIYKHRTTLAKNYRLATAVAALSRMQPNKLHEHLDRAKKLVGN